MSHLGRDALEAGEGILRLAPCWVPRRFLVPGGRLKLHPHDLYSFGIHRGGIDERWLCSVTKADNGPGALMDEGLSYIVHEGKRALLQEALAEIGETHWHVLAKLFDNRVPIPFHLHQAEEHARRVGRSPKPEAYYFPPQYNLVDHGFPYSFLGLNPGVTPADIRRCLTHWDRLDNDILHHSRAFKLRLGTAWQIDAGILHAPGTLVTYEVQGPSDVSAVFQNVHNHQPVAWSALVKDVPPELHHDLDYILDMIDWECNVDPHFVEHRLLHPRRVGESDGAFEKWVIYSTAYYSAKELTVHPGHSVFIKEQAAYGVLVVQGFGTIGKLSIETPSKIRFGQLTNDELFVTTARAKEGVTVTNRSDKENLVLLKHFGPAYA